MNKVIGIALGIIVIGVIAWLAFSGNSNEEPNSNSLSQSSPEVINSTNAGVSNPSSSGQATTVVAGKYVDYSESAYNSAKDKKRVLYFHAAWCPTCKVANEDFVKNGSQIPEGVVILKTDYDTEKALKEKYGITYQHTFVQVDANGNEITKWNGGGLSQLKAKVN